MAERSLRATAYDKAPTELVAESVEYAAAERWKRAALIFVPLFAGALASLPVPGWHLFAVPGFLIAAFVFGARRLRQTESVTALRGVCPACGAEQSFAAPGRLVLPSTLNCPGCSEFVKIAEA
jgi:hypothetical protein